MLVTTTCSIDASPTLGARCRWVPLQVGFELGEDCRPIIASVLSYLVLTPWRLIAAFIPPPTMGTGWPCFFVCIGVIGLVTAGVHYCP